MTRLSKIGQKLKGRETLRRCRHTYYQLRGLVPKCWLLYDNRQPSLTQGYGYTKGLLTAPSGLKIVVPLTLDRRWTLPLLTDNVSARAGEYTYSQGQSR